MQVGYVGLLKAINNFDPAFGGALAAYAQPCISGEIKRHFRDKRWQVRVKRSAQELLLEMRKAAGDLAQELGHAPSDAELARHLGVTDEELQEARQADMFFHTSSLDAPLTQADGPARLADLIGADDPELERALDMDAVGAHWNELPPRAAHPADAVLREPDSGRDRRAARHLPDARVPPPGDRPPLPAGMPARPGDRRRQRARPAAHR